MTETGPSPGWFAEHTAFDSGRKHPSTDETTADSFTGIEVVVARLSNINTESTENPEVQGLKSWLAARIFDLVKLSEQSKYVCQFVNGKFVIKGRRIDNHRLYEPVDIPPGRAYSLDYADRHYVSHAYQHDIIEGFADVRQVFVAAIGEQIAISSKQLLMSIIHPDGGHIALHERPS